MQIIRRARKKQDYAHEWSSSLARTHVNRPRFIFKPQYSGLLAFLLLQQKLRRVLAPPRSLRTSLHISLRCTILKHRQVCTLLWPLIYSHLCGIVPRMVGKFIFSEWLIASAVRLQVNSRAPLRVSIGRTPSYHSFCVPRYFPSLVALIHRSIYLPETMTSALS